MSMTVTEQKSRDIYYDTASDSNPATLSSSSIIAWMTARLLQTSKHPIFETKNGCGCYIRFSRMQMHLDRVRFGMRAVDPKYFRNEMAHKLLPTAQSCVGQLKL